MQFPTPREADAGEASPNSASGGGFGDRSERASATLAVHVAVARIKESPTLLERANGIVDWRVNVMVRYLHRPQ
jgi:hypothetical protein